MGMGEQSMLAFETLSCLLAAGKCPHPGNITFGSVHPAHGSLMWQAHIKYSCNKGYVLKGPSVVYCGFGGKNLPTCVPASELQSFCSEQHITMWDFFPSKLVCTNICLSRTLFACWLVKIEMLRDFSVSLLQNVHTLETSHMDQWSLLLAALSLENTSNTPAIMGILWKAGTAKNASGMVISKDHLPDASKEVHISLDPLKCKTPRTSMIRDMCLPRDMFLPLIWCGFLWMTNVVNVSNLICIETPFQFIPNNYNCFTLLQEVYCWLFHSFNVIVSISFQMPVKTHLIFHLARKEFQAEPLMMKVLKLGTVVILVTKVEAQVCVFWMETGLIHQLAQVWFLILIQLMSPIHNLNMEVFWHLCCFM